MMTSWRSHAPPEAASECWDAIVVGAGAAGLLAAIGAAERGRRVLVLEKNRKPGVKILISGGTRCNLTQATDARGIVAAYGQQGSFLHSALAALGPETLVGLVEAEGVPTKVEATGKIFPASDRALDVLRALWNRLERSGAWWKLGEGVCEVACQGQEFLVRTDQQTYRAAHLVLTTGGCSYPGCGTVGDGYRWAEQLGHRIVSPRPALVPLCCELQWVRDLQGVTVPDVQLRAAPPTVAGEREKGAPKKGAQPNGRRTARGPLLFTHFGLSGPSVLDISRHYSARLSELPLPLHCDFLPAFGAEGLRELLQDQRTAAPKRGVAAVLAEQLPRRLVEALLELAGIDSQLRLAELGRKKIAALTRHVHAQELPVAGTLGFKKAEVTAGGIALDEVDSRTLESKRVPGLYLAGEILDLDGPIGGYNFQAAFSTGWLAGQFA